MSVSVVALWPGDTIANVVIVLFVVGVFALVLWPIRQRRGRDE
jgi:hypothetical protein